MQQYKQVYPMALVLHARHLSAVLSQQNAARFIRGIQIRERSETLQQFRLRPRRMTSEIENRRAARLQRLIQKR